MTFVSYKKLFSLLLVVLSMVAAIELGVYIYKAGLLKGFSADKEVFSRSVINVSDSGDSRETLKVEENMIIKDSGDIFVKWDNVIVLETQKAVDNGNQPWRLDVILTSLTFINDRGVYDINPQDLMVVKQLDNKAVVRVKGIRDVKVIYLEKLADKSEYGVWFVTSYDE